MYRLQNILHTLYLFSDKKEKTTHKLKLFRKYRTFSKSFIQTFMEWRGNKILFEKMNNPKSEGIVLEIYKLCNCSENFVYYICFCSMYVVSHLLFCLNFKIGSSIYGADVKLIAAEVDNQIVCGQFVCFLF